MQYAHWTNNDEFKEKLVKHDGLGVLEESGFPIMYDNNNFCFFATENFFYDLSESR